MESVLEEKVRDYKIILTREGETWLNQVLESKTEKSGSCSMKLFEAQLIESEISNDHRFILPMNVIKNQDFQSKNWVFFIKTLNLIFQS